MKIYAEVPSNLQGYAIYQLEPIKSGLDDYYGWKAVKQKQVTETIDDKEVISQVDDDEAQVIYDEKSALYKKLEEQSKLIEQLLAKGK